MTCTAFWLLLAAMAAGVLNIPYVSAFLSIALFVAAVGAGVVGGFCTAFWVLVAVHGVLFLLTALILLINRKELD